MGNNRTQIVCLHEGDNGSIDPLFIRTVLKALKPAWIRWHEGSNIIRSVPCGGRKNLIDQMPGELELCLKAGGDTTLVVLADVDDEPKDPDALREMFWNKAEQAGISRDQFETVVFILPRDRLENWIEFLETGETDEAIEGKRVKYPKQASDAAKELASRCQGKSGPALPPSLDWSCKNWRDLCKRMS